MTVEQLYQQYIKSISAAEQLELISLISRKLIRPSEPKEKKRRSLLELEGLGYFDDAVVRKDKEES